MNNDTKLENNKNFMKIDGVSVNVTEDSIYCSIHLKKLPKNIPHVHRLGIDIIFDIDNDTNRISNILLGFEFYDSTSRTYSIDSILDKSMFRNSPREYTSKNSIGVYGPTLSINYLNEELIIKADKNEQEILTNISDTSRWYVKSIYWNGQGLEYADFYSPFYKKNQIKTLE